MTNGLNRTDQPIQSSAEDLLDRSRYVRIVADEIRRLDASKGAVVGILGPWGAGKTSLMNMLSEQLRSDSERPILEFNPWLFSGTEQLVNAFFEEIAAQLRLKAERVQGLAADFEAYGDALSPLRFIPVVGPWLDRIGVAGRTVARLIKRESQRRTGITQLRDRLEKRLNGLANPLVVTVSGRSKCTRKNAPKCTTQVADQLIGSGSFARSLARGPIPGNAAARTS